MARRPWVWLGLLCLGISCGFGSPARAKEGQAGSDAGPSYPLDDIPRVLEPGSPLPCQSGDVPLVNYRGARLKYQKPMRIHPAFQAQLAAFEALVSEVALAHYGREPQRIVHLGTYNCRVMRRYPSWVSEHALGNAIDIAGFDFGALPRKSPRYASLPAKLRGALKVRVDSHWSASGNQQAHSDFLHDLARKIAERPEVFHVLLGPGYPGHHNHFHLDHAPYRVVDYVEARSSAREPAKDVRN
ncbi:MAG: extensin family protein [Myxococcales bacterium]